jgi:DNA mismatch repair ATPase MutS
MLLARSRHPLQEVTRGIEEPRRELLVLARVLARLEQEPFESPLLVDLHHHLHADGRAASRRLARLDKLAYLLELPGNQLFAPVAIATLWSIHVAYALEQWRERYGPYVPQWLDAVGALEALLALATYAYEHPSDPFPELVEGSILFDGRQLAHPILPENLCVRNSVCLDDALRLLVVSGSNMSGKSTLLRMVGVNAVLAQAGAPVRAEALRMSPLALGATLRVQDSLQSGASRFYAEIERLKQVMDLAENGATLFLFDEILSGTNSHDRRIGAAEVLRALLDRGAAGIVTTHDLALTQIADHLGAIASNVHFTDEWRDGAIIFPYTLKPGVVRQGNALRLMARLGLPVGPDDDRFANLESAPPQ